MIFKTFKTQIILKETSKTLIFLESDKYIFTCAFISYTK